MTTTTMPFAAFRNRSEPAQPPLEAAKAGAVPRAVSTTGSRGGAGLRESFLARAFATWASGGNYR